MLDSAHTSSAVRITRLYSVNDISACNENCEYANRPERDNCSGSRAEPVCVSLQTASQITPTGRHAE